MARRRYKKPPQGEYEISIDRLSHDGRGIANIDGKTIFIQYALPGEQIKFVYTETHSKYDVGRAIEVMENSHPDRVQAQCPHFGVCGGCSLQHLSNKAQLNLKQTNLLELIENTAHVQAQNILPPLTANSWGYRRKARLGVRYVEKKGLPLVGFREVDGQFLCDSDSCEVLHPSLGKKIQALREMLDTISIKHKVAQIEVSITDESKVLIFRNLEAFSDEDLKILAQFAVAHDFKIYLQPGKQKSIHGLKGEPLENQFYTLPEFDLKMIFSPIDFTQVNFEINQLMVAHAVKLLQLTKQDDVLDLFCGLGNFSLAIARFAKHVVGVEGSEIMAERATENAKGNNIDNTQFFASDLMEDFTATHFAKIYDKLLIDPPRSGAMKVVENIELFNPKRIVYVSCNPATLARDINILVNSKCYILESVGVMDMFPHTSHVESIAVLTKNGL